MAAAMLEVAPVEATTVEEVMTWPGVWSATSRFTGWAIQADPAQRAEDTIASSRKLAEVTGRSVVIERMVIYP
jgi:hypothetical protein